MHDLIRNCSLTLYTQFLTNPRDMWQSLWISTLRLETINSINFTKVFWVWIIWEHRMSKFRTILNIGRGCHGFHQFHGSSMYKNPFIVQANRLRLDLGSNDNYHLHSPFRVYSNSSWNRGPRQSIGSDWKLFKATMKGEINKFVNNYPYLSVFLGATFVISGNVSLLIFTIFVTIMYYLWYSI